MGTVKWQRMRVSDYQMTGLAGQYLTCCDLITKGVIAYPVAEGLPYDLVADGIHKLLRIQVKTCRVATLYDKKAELGRVYNYCFQKGRGHSTSRYKEDEVDIFALVALDIRRVGYLLAKDCGSAIRLRSDFHKGEYQCDKTEIRRNEIIQLYKNKMSIPDICKKLGISDSTVHNHLNPNYKFADSSSRYFSAIERSSEWFKEIFNADK